MHGTQCFLGAEVCTVHYALSVRKEVLLEPDVVVTDQNAASQYVRFASGIDGLRIMNREMVYAEDWRHEDKRLFFHHRSVKCAGALVPDRVRPEYVRGAYVSCEETRIRVEAIAPLGFLIKVSPSFFFH